MLREIRARTKAWVWFKGGLNGGEWRGLFYSTGNAEHAEAVTLQHSNSKTAWCRSGISASFTKQLTFSKKWIWRCWIPEF